MEKKLIGWGALSGAIAGLLAFVFARIFAEPRIQAAVDYESGREEARHALERAAGTAVGEHDEAALFTRAVQGNLGLGAGLVVFGLAMGLLFAVVYTVCLGRAGKLGARALALAVAGAGFLTLYLTPFVKYPANPPAAGDPDTIGTRGGLYLLMVVGSVLFCGAAVWLGRRVAPKLGNWNATLLGGLLFVVLSGVLMAVLPSAGATEIPQPLTGPAGQLVYPGFPADVLAAFRLYSVGAQVILWGALGLVFAPLADRTLHRDRVPAIAG